MAQLMRIPLKDGKFMVAEVDQTNIPKESVVLASPKPGQAVAQATRTLESSLLSLGPALSGLTDTLRVLAPQTVSVEFGVKLGGETGVILAKGTAEVHFTVKVEWSPKPPPDSGPPPDNGPPADNGPSADNGSPAG
ncbi:MULTISPECIES: CU044_2847 family protein [unclassified Streptomyces]|uniref:CU044_2847 family protein n=1 Tax=unclassified Streptomyces TaxID=2593676 RepID=UPI00278BDE28|nr:MULTISPECIES: CU044_2847 family protein [unclassified Streptomyces]